MHKITGRAIGARSPRATRVAALALARLANSLGHELAKAEAQKTRLGCDSARDYFERAMKIDPQTAEAVVGLALARYTARALGWSTAAEDTHAAQLDLLTKATAINPGYAFAHYVKSLVLFHKQLPEAIETGRLLRAASSGPRGVGRFRPRSKRREGSGKSRLGQHVNRDYCHDRQCRSPRRKALYARVPSIKYPTPRDMPLVAGSGVAI
jgi:hypothetical protein